MGCNQPSGFEVRMRWSLLGDCPHVAYFQLYFPFLRSCFLSCAGAAEGTLLQLRVPRCPGAWVRSFCALCVPVPAAQLLADGLWCL